MIGVKGYGGRASRCLIGFFLILYLACPGYAQTVSGMKSLLSEQGQVLFGDEPNSLLIIDYPENIERVDEYLLMVDVQPQQVHIEARIVEVKLQSENSLGIDWTAFANSGLDIGNVNIFSSTAGGAITTAGVIDYSNFSLIKNPPISGSTANTDPFTLNFSHKNIDIAVRALANEYDTDILSAPSITTINNHEAVIKMIDIYPWAEPTITTVENSNPEISYEMNFEEAGIILKVTPTISENGKITMDLQLEISEKTDDYEIIIDPGSGANTITYTIPIIETRQAKTKVVVGSGETLIIGGLIKNKEIESEIKIPFLGDIPYLGYLFKSTRKTMDKKELVIFVSPTIIGFSEMEYGKKLEKKIRRDIEGDKSKLEMTPMKEVAVLKKKKEAASADRKAREEEALKKEVDKLYAQAVSLYADRQLKKARSEFQKILRYDPTHQKALNFLETKIPDGLKEQRMQIKTSRKKVTPKTNLKPIQAKSSEDQELLERKRQEDAVRKKQKEIARQKKRQAALKVKKLYSVALSFYRKKDYSAAQTKLQELEAVNPGYSRSEYYLAKIPGLIEAEALAKKEREIREKKAALKTQVAEVYQVAMSLYKLKKYQEAYLKFQGIQELRPDYRKTVYYLSKIPKIIKKKEAAVQSPYQKDRQQVVKELLNACE